MTSLVSLLAAAALVALQHSFVDALPMSNYELDNSLDSTFSALPAPRRSRPHKVAISRPPPETVAWSPAAGLRVECEVFASPAPSVQWLRNGEPIADSEEDTDELIPVEPSSVARAISRLRLESAADGDVLTCVARSGPARAAASTVVRAVADSADDETALMLQRLKHHSSRPLIVYSFSDLLQEMGTAVVLPCRVAGQAKVHWQDNMGNMVFGDDRMKILTSGDLLISRVRWEDMGEYVCTARGPRGEDSAATFLYPLRRKGH